MYVKTQYVDASTDTVPARSGPALPHPELVVTFVDRRQMPAQIYGSLPSDADASADVITELSQAEYEAALTEYIDHRRAIIQGHIESADLTDTQRNQLLDDANNADTLDALRQVRADLQAAVEDV